MEKEKTNQENKSSDTIEEKCGIIMPISSIDGLPDTHWTDVYAILEESINKAGYAANIVSNGAHVGIIHKNIINNLYENPIVVCDVSGKNPNVMFELGLRLAFDKPTIIVKDDKTNYSFDTSPIQHLEYPRDLRYSSILDFKKDLTSKIKATVEAAKKPDYSTFLKHFGRYKISSIEETEVGREDYLLRTMEEMKEIVNNLKITENKKKILYDAKNSIFTGIASKRNLPRNPDIEKNILIYMRKSGRKLDLTEMGDVFEYVLQNISSIYPSENVVRTVLDHYFHNKHT